MASAVDSRLAYARLSAVATASRLPTANRGSNNSYTTSWDTTRCIEAMPPAAELVADKGYDSKALRDWLAERGTTAVIPPSKNRKVQYHYDKTVYRQPTSSSACFAASRTGAV